MIKATYTKLFKDWLSEPASTFPRNTYKTALLTQFTSVIIDKDILEDMLENLFRFYEIGSDDNDEMLQFMVDVYKENLSYYEELLTNYNKAYDIATSNKRTTTKTETMGVISSRSSQENTSDKHTEIALPNKVVESTYEGTPSEINKDEGQTNHQGTVNANTTKQNNSTVTFDNEFLDLKNKYINQIRNVYKEFASKFIDCFMIIY